MNKEDIFPAYSIKETREKYDAVMDEVEKILLEHEISQYEASKEQRENFRNVIGDEVAAAMATLVFASRFLKVDTLEEILVALNGLAD